MSPLTFRRAVRRKHPDAPPPRKAQRGMTLLEIMIVLAIIALVMGLLIGPKVMKMFGESKVDIATMTAKKFANEAFPQWSAHHPDKGCPESLQDLTDYMNNNSIKDPWGNPFKMMCGENVPAAAKSAGFAVTSPGPDGKEGTSDDIKSWE